MGFGINQADVQRALENQNTPSLDIGTVDSGSSVTVVKVSGQSLVANGYIGQSLVFNSNTFTTALQNVGVLIVSNTTNSITVASPGFPALPTDQDTFVIRSLGGGANISGVGGSALPQANGGPALPTLTTTGPTLVAKVATGTAALANTAILYTYGTPPSVTATVTVGVSPYGVAVDETTNSVYVANLISNTVSVIDGATDTVTATIAVGTEPSGIAVDETTNTIYVANNGANTVSVIDGATDTVTATIAVGNSPVGIAVDETTHAVYVANYASNTVSVFVSGANNAAAVTVGGSPHGIAVDETAHTVYVANYASNTVSVVAAGSTYHYTAPYNGTVNVHASLSASAKLSYSLNAGASSPAYSNTNGGNALTANAGYSFSIPVLAGEVVDFEIDSTADLNIFDATFIATQ